MLVGLIGARKGLANTPGPESDSLWRAIYGFLPCDTIGMYSRAKNCHSQPHLLDAVLSEMSYDGRTCVVSFPRFHSCPSVYVCVQVGALICLLPCPLYRCVHQEETTHPGFTADGCSRPFLQRRGGLERPRQCVPACIHKGLDGDRWHSKATSIPRSRAQGRGVRWYILAHRQESERHARRVWLAQSEGFG